MRYGYFDDAKREYVVERPDVPVSWTNYLGRNDTCGVISHNAGGYAFHQSSGRGRFIRFRPNSLPMDRPGRCVYLRDEADGEFWTLSWQPTLKDLGKAKYETRHGLSYSSFSARYRDIEGSQTVFIPLGESAEVWDVRLRNLGDSPRKISVCSYLEFAFHHLVCDNYDFQYSLYATRTDCRDGVIQYEFIGVETCFFAASFDPDSFDADREAFMGPYRTEANPIAVERGRCSGFSMNGGNPCGALQKTFDLQPGQEVRFAFVVGIGSRDAAGRKLRDKYADPANLDREFARLQAHWEEKLSNLQCQTPDPGLTSFVNIWNLYQVETCVTWSRFASFVEVGGRNGLGYRDTSQDVMAVVQSSPDRARQRILELLSAQVAEGYGIHLFDPLTLKPGQEKAPPLEDVCSDDVLWLVVTVCEYVKETGDLAFFDRVVPFADQGEATVYEHLKRGLDFSEKQVGPHGICLGLKADWNDCINLRGGGESAMVSFNHYWALGAFIAAAEKLGRQEDAARYARSAAKVREAVNRTLWDGEWWVRAITGKGLKVGSKENEEGWIYLNSQSWAVLSGLAEGERALRCMDSVKEHLFSEYGLHICHPSYTKLDWDVGFVTNVPPGLKENGAVFSHPNPWAIIAECMLGRGDRAFEFYSAILPYNQNDRIEVREAEPYSFCQFVCGKDHVQFGRARHPWLTGTAGWFYTAASRYILGIRPDFDGLVVDPCIPASWKGFTATRKFRGAAYDIEVRNPQGVSKGVAEVTLNGEKVGKTIPVRPRGSVNKVVVTLGIYPSA